MKTQQVRTRRTCKPAPIDRLARLTPDEPPTSATRLVSALPFRPRDLPTRRERSLESPLDWPLESSVALASFIACFVSFPADGLVDAGKSIRLIRLKR